jgi:hypothetical protein
MKLSAGVVDHFDLGEEKPFMKVEIPDSLRAWI